jgi:hypothetical protein
MNTEVTVLPSGSNPHASNALVDLEFGNVSDFKRKMLELKQKMDFMQEFFQQVMVKDEDYGTIPGTGKPTLYKPGAEKLCELYGFAAHIKSKEEEKEYETGYYRALITVQLIHRSTGVIVGEGVGECNTNESKYRYRWVYENKIPRHLDKTDLHFEEKDEWKNGQKTGSTYKQYRVPNDDLYSQWNTVLKMAHKRAFTGVTLQCTRSSGIFTQDESEMDEWADVPEGDRKKAKGQKGASGSNGQQTGNRSSGQTAVGKSAAGGNDKNRAFELAKSLCGGAMDWKWLGERAAEVLSRPINKVVSEVKEDEWKTVVGYLEQYGNGQQQGELNYDELPEELR